jgi:nitroreductase
VATTTVPQTQTPPQTTGAATTRGTWWERRRAEVELLRNYLYDLHRFRTASFLNGPDGPEHRRAQIAILAHTLEYGMALRDPRDGFGLEKVEQLVALLIEHQRAGDDGDAQGTVARAAAVLDAYAQTQQGPGRQIALDGLRELSTGEVHPVAGTEHVTAAGIRAATEGVDLDTFLRARHSVRQFAPGRLDPDVLRTAVDQALLSPSSCNRQTSTVHAYTRAEEIAVLLNHLSGSAGFGDQLGALLVVTVDLRNWNTVGERNQAFVDGGMFAMTLILALHAQGLGTCPINWSADRHRDAAMRASMGLGPEHVIITRIGVGALPDDLRVPVSLRRPTNAVFRLDEPLH